ncbi:MAG: EbsC protein [Thermofilum sp. ex4484_82]|nr:MAG: EbsC protein [Thermofilum sp. ex4484_82]OYT40026.1 MAG: EbsC protein [Archaeoglobales archaeon ex4484_92]RLE77861.1 MAG: YbaK/EbsC family protein [Thermoprotei archaeon]
MTLENAIRLMEKLNIEGEIISHSQSGKTTREASKALNIDPGFILKSLLLVSKKKKHVAVIITGDKRVDFKKVEKITGFKKLRLATPSEVEAVTGFKVGGVPPFAFHDKCPVIVDEEVMKKNFVIGACGDEFHGIKLNPEVFIKLGYRIADIVES